MRRPRPFPLPDFLLFSRLAWTESARLSSPEQAERNERATQRGRIGEMDAVHAERSRRRGIARIVVDIDRFFRRDGETLEQQAKDPRIGLDHADLAGNQDAAKPA